MTAVDPVPTADPVTTRTSGDPAPTVTGAEPVPIVAAGEPVRSERPGATPVDWLLVVLITLLAAFIAVIGLAFLPLYAGSVPLPISASLGVGAMILGPRACYRLTGSLAAAVAPVLAWFAVSVWVVLKHNSVMPMVPLTVVSGQWRVMLLLGLGSLAAAATIGLIWADRVRARLATALGPVLDASTPGSASPN